MNAPPLGTLSCSASERGITRIEFGVQCGAQLQSLPSDSIPEGIQLVLQECLNQIAAYLHRQRQEFRLPLDLSSCTRFQVQVLEEVQKVPYGGTITYQKIADKVGGSKFVRAVGGAVGSNPLPVVIPCHRVVSTGGQLRGYSGWGGIRTKAWLLQLEGAQLISETPG